MDETQTQEDSHSVPPPRLSIEGYEIVRELHRGGQGVVYEAVQKATKRKVAVKVLLEGPHASKAARKRFEREIDLVAQLRHPNIIMVFDSGVTPDDHHYYVMDYVRGVPLQDFVREKKLTLEETLRLFGTVCDAVQHAHQKGVMHRDLKPSNIIVDTEGQPRVLDFGLAKQLASPVDTLVTVSQHVLGTLPYMSPEQTRGNPDEIDTRTDVYSLGVVLYELLTGQFPYPVTGQMAEVLKSITETPPTPPSRRWTSESGVTRRSGKRLRAGECPIDDEVQTIIFKTLAKERDRRYQSAGELGRDVGHYLASEPIEAKRDSAFYVLRKHLRRYKVPVAVSLAFFVLLIAALTVTTRLYLREQLARSGEVEQRHVAETERDRARVAEEEAQRQRDLAQSEREEARRQAYHASISAAHVALSTNDVTTARRYLYEAPADLRNWEWKYLDTRLDRSLRTIDLPIHNLDLVYFDSNLERAIVRDKEHRISVWDLVDSRELAAFSGSTRHRFRLSHDRSRIATWDRHSSSSYAGIRVLDTSTGELVVSLTDKEAEIGHYFTWSANGRRIAASASDAKQGPTPLRTVKVWDADSGVLLDEVRVDWRFGCGLAFNHDGTMLAITSDEEPVLWYPGVSDSVTSLESAGLDAVVRMALSPDDRYLAGVGWSTSGITSGFISVVIWEVSTGRIVGRSEDIQRPTGYRWWLRFDPAGSRLVFASEEALLLLQVPSGAEIAHIKPHLAAVTTFSWSPDSTYLATGSTDATVRVWDPATGERVATLRGHTEPVLSVQFSRNAEQIISMAGNGSVKVWDARTRSDGAALVLEAEDEGTKATCSFRADGLLTAELHNRLELLDPLTLQSVMTLPDYRVSPAALSPGMDYAVARDGARTVTVWDTSSGESIRKLGHYTHGFMGRIVLSPNGLFAAVADAEVADVWNVLDGKKLFEVNTDGAKVNQLRFSSDSRFLTVSRADNTAAMWEVASAEELLKLPDHDMAVNDAVLSFDGRLLATASRDLAIRLWDVSSGQLLATIKGHNAPVTCLSLDPSGTRLVSGSYDRTVRLWDLASRREVLTLRGHTKGILDVAFSHDGTRIAAVSVKALRVWDLVPERVRVAATRRADALRSQAEPIVKRWLSEPLFAYEVIARLQQDESISPEVRQAAISLAHRQTRSASRLNQSSGAVVREAGATRTACATAIREAQEACRLDPGNASYVKTLSVAQYRNRQYGAALATLQRSYGLKASAVFDDVNQQMQRARSQAEQLDELAPPTDD